MDGRDPRQRYRFDGRIATGGMGEVWRATDVVLGREVAVKLLKAEFADDPAFRSRFETEARNAAALHHPNVAAVFDYGERPEEDGGGARPFLVMELVRGEPLSNLLRDGQRMPADTAAHLMAQVADGLAAAHALGIVHRDIKPANLLVSPDRTVKITDFGIARAVDSVALTQTGQVLGTPQYLSPEQAEGKQATAASDIYSVGVVLYECLAGERPFGGDSPVATALAHLRDQPPPLAADVPGHLREIVAVCLAKDPAARFATVQDLASALRGGPVRGGGATTVVDRSGDDATRSTRVLGAGAAAAGGAAAGAAAGSAADDWRAWDEDPEFARTSAGTPGGGASTGQGNGPAGSGSRRKAWVPWAVGAVVVLAAVAALAWLSNRNDDTGSADPGSEPTADASTSAPASSPATEEPTTPPSSSAPPEPERVEVRESDYVGRPADEARSDLEDLGVRVSERTVANPGDEEAGTVADVSPTGRVKEGSTVTLSVYGEPTPTPTPTPTQTPSQSDNGGSSGSGDDGSGGTEGGDGQG